MGLVDKVESHRSAIDYKVKECVRSRRSQLQLGSEVYCILSSGEDYHYCPLQDGDGGRKLFKCLRDDYIAELNERNK